MRVNFTLYQQKAGRLLLLSMLVYTILPAAISCGTGLMALCDMSTAQAQASELMCCPSTNGAGNSIDLPLIADMSNSNNSSHCDMPSEKDDARASDCGLCPCNITESKTPALHSGAVVQQTRSETSVQLEQLANQIASHFSIILTAASESGISASVNATLSKAALQFEQRPQHTPLRIQHCSYLI